MTMALALAWRNVLRNRRRSLITMLTIALGAAALQLLGGLMSYIVLEFQTSTVRRTGHLAVLQSGYFSFGAGSPAAYGIADYTRVLDLIRSDADIAPRLQVSTPSQQVTGVAGNYRANASKTFFGLGVVPADRLRMREWDQHGIEDLATKTPPLGHADSVAVGSGIARILLLCRDLALANCPMPPAPKPAAVDAVSGEDAALAQLRLRETSAEGAKAQADGPVPPRIELLAATAGGAPNVLSVLVERADALGSKELDDNFIVMQLGTAQQLVYGRSAPRATALNLLLHRTEDVPVVRAALQRLFKAHGLDLEVRDFAELNSMYTQTKAFFDFLFSFVALVIGTIVLFTIMNTMSMSVMERVNEIGTSRALGAQRGAIRGLFVTEGALQGVMGATLGMLLAAGVVLAVNQAHLTWNPPTSAGAVPFKLYLLGNPALLAGTWLVLVAVAAAASLVPAHRASRMVIVDALRHV